MDQKSGRESNISLYRRPRCEKKGLKNIDALERRQLVNKCHGRQGREEGRVEAIIRDKRGKMRLVSHGREVREEGRYTLWKPTERKEHAESIRYKYAGYVLPI